MSKIVKGMMIETISHRLGTCKDMLVLNTSKLDAFADNKLRAQAKKKGITLLQVKNTLARRALEAGGVKSLEAALQGPSVLVWGGEDIVALSKEIAKWAKDLKTLEIKGGTVDGQSLDAKGVEELSKSPGRVELIGKILGQILSPGGRVAGALLGAGGILAGQVKAIEEKSEATAAPETAA